MEGISKGSLEKLLLDGCAKKLIDINLVTKILCECKELNQWQPTETAPKDRRILLFYNGVKTVGMWGPKYKCWLDEVNFQVEPTHWQELPEDPK